MVEYIEREALMKELSESTEPFNTGSVFRAIRKQPAADVAPVAHGRWEWFDEETGTPFTGYEREWGWKCSYCGEELPDDYDDPDNRPTFRFCHSCGAKMDGGVDDAAD